MENISDSRRVVTDTSDSKPDSGRSIFDKARTFLRRAGQAEDDMAYNMREDGESLQEADTSNIQEKLKKFADKADIAGRRIDEAGFGWLLFGEDGVLPFAGEEVTGTGLMVVGEMARGAAKVEEEVEKSLHSLGRGIETAGEFFDTQEHGKEVVENYETAAGFASLAYEEKEDKRGIVEFEGKQYERDLDLSNQNNALDVFSQINAKDGTKPDLYIVYKGTNPKHMKDLHYDWNIFKDSTENTDMYKEYDRLTKAVFDKYGDTHKIHMVGHSKGGHEVSKLSCVYHPESAITFNKGAVPWEAKCEDRKTHVHNFTTGFDLISAATYLQRKKESTHFISTNKDVSIFDPAYYHNMDHFIKKKDD